MKRKDGLRYAVELWAPGDQHIDEVIVGASGLWWHEPPGRNYNRPSDPLGAALVFGNDLDTLAKTLADFMP